MSVGMILQARMGSKRLPGKIFAEIGPRTLLEHILYRLTALSEKYPLVIATSSNSGDDIVEKWCMDRNCRCFRGSEYDVLNRFYECATRFEFDHIVRLTGDNPFVDTMELCKLIELHLETGADYSHSFGDLPIGVGSEIFTFGALKESHIHGHDLNYREHVNEYILENPHLFKITKLSVDKTKCHPDIRLTVDTPEDLERARRIVAAVNEDYITTEDAILACSHCA